MKIKRFLVVVTALAVANASFAWGPKGHAVIADIASHHISDCVAEKVDKVLMGETMVDVSSWMDGIRKIPKYEHTYTWHFCQCGRSYTYETMPKEPKGDVYTQLNHVVEQLKSGTRPPKTSGTTCVISFTWWGICTARCTPDTAVTWAAIRFR